MFCCSFREFKGHSYIGKSCIFCALQVKCITCAVHSHIARSTGHAVECSPPATRWSVVHWPHGGVRSTGHAVECGPLATRWSAVHWPRGGVRSTGHTVECGPLATRWSAVHWPHGAFCKAVMGLLLRVHCTCTLYVCTCTCPPANVHVHVLYSACTGASLVQIFPLPRVAFNPGWLPVFHSSLNIFPNLSSCICVVFSILVVNCVRIFQANCIVHYD